MSFADRLFRFSLIAAATAVLLVFSGVVLLLFKEGLPALQTFGCQFITSTEWNPVSGQYGAGSVLYGTVLTTCIAAALAVPVSMLMVFFLTEVVPCWLVLPISLSIQLLAAVPSIVYGMWGFFIVAPIMASTIDPFLISIFTSVPFIGLLFVGTPFGVSFLTAGIVLALMIVPFITSMVLGIIKGVPAVLKEAGYGMGSTSWEVFYNVLVPYGKKAIVGAVMLGLGRALGEATAVTFVIGNATRLSASLLAPGATIASVIHNEFNETEPGSIKFHVLVELGFILLVISSLVFALSRLIVRSPEK